MNKDKMGPMSNNMNKDKMGPMGNKNDSMNKNSGMKDERHDNMGRPGKTGSHHSSNKK